MAASATFALKAGVWFRRGRLFICSPDSRANLARRQAETPLSALCRFPEPALSISTEWFFYLAFPLLLMRWKRTWWWKWIASGLLIAALVVLGKYSHLPI